MFDRKSPLAILVEAELNKDGAMGDLRRMAMKLAMSHEADVKDLLAKSLVRVIDPDVDPWRPGAHTFLAHMYIVMRSVRYRQRRKVRLNGEVLDGGIAQDRTASDGPRADDELERSPEVLRKLGELVLARLGSDSLPRQIYETALKEDLDPSEEAARFHCTVGEIRAAHARIKYHGRIVLDEWNASEERRMKTLRDRTKRQSEEGTP
jgi:DNA-directed RNA polymerase specialized sigma24 family protein